MIYELMRHCRNFFVAGASQGGTWKIENGGINLPFLLDGQYFLVEGSVFNDGVYQYPAYDLVSEVFEGFITPLAPPKAFIELADEIGAWRAKNEALDNENMSPFASESFGGYSYSKPNGSVSWKEAFKSRINEWRKL